MRCAALPHPQRAADAQHRGRFDIVHAADVVYGLQEFGCRVDIYDPWADPAAVRTEYGLTSVKDLKALASNYDAIVAAVAHREFSDMSLRKYTCADGVIFDLKGFVPRDIVDGRL